MISERLRADLVALLLVVSLGIAGILTPQEAFSGFGRSTFVLLIAIFILAEGLARAGVTEKVGLAILRLSGRGEARLVTVVMLSGAFLSLFMNNVAAAAILLPAATGAARKAGVSPSRLLMPLAFGTLLGGMATLLTTTNIVVSGLLKEHGIRDFDLLDFLPLGLPLIAAGVAYMTFWGRHVLPRTSPSEQMQQRPGPEADLVDLYRLSERLFRARIPAGSVLVGRALSESHFRETYNLSVVAIERGKKVELAPSPGAILQQGDVVLLEGELEAFLRRDIEPHLEILPPREWQERDLESATVVAVEAMLSPRSSLIGRSLREAHFRVKYGMSVLAVWRAGRRLLEDLTDLKLQFGDALFLQGPRERLGVLRTEPDLILLTHGSEESPPVPGRGWLALGLLLSTLACAALNPDGLGETMLAGALAMILARILTMDQAYASIEWKSVFLVAAMLPVGTAVTKSGLAAIVGGWFSTVAASAGLTAVVAGLVLMSVLLSQAMHGAAAAAIMAPLAIEAAGRIGAQPRPLAMAVALATSMTFLTPFGHPVNVMVMAPGGYRIRDFLRVGLPLALILIVLLIALLPLVWSLRVGGV